MEARRATLEGETAAVAAAAAAVAAAEAAEAAEAAAELSSYGQLRMRHVLSKRRWQIGETGPEDLLILQPTSIGAGINEGFVEVSVVARAARSFLCLFLSWWRCQRLRSVVAGGNAVN